MPYQTTMVTFGAWLPDDDRNIRPGFPVMWESGSAVPLQDVKNCIFTGSSYRPWMPPVAQGIALPVSPVDAYTAYFNGTNYLIAGSGAALYYSTNGGTSWTACGSGFKGAGWTFCQYSCYVYATNGVDPIQVMELDAATPAFTALAAAAPTAFQIGIIRDFVVAGNLPTGVQPGAFTLQWSGLAAPATWDTPNTQQSRADQSGAQTMYSQYGAIQHIAQGEELAVVFQETGISRVQYVGGDVVFSFYTFERKRGLLAPRAVAQLGNAVHFLAADGFCVTDGQSVQSTGYGQVNRYFFDDCTDVQQVRAAIDSKNQCIVWSYPNASGWAQLAYNFAEKQWTRAAYASPLLYQGMNGTAYEPQTFDSSNVVNRFVGSPTDCEITTKQFRFDPAHHALVVGVRVLSDDNATAGVASMDEDTDTPTFIGYGAPETISDEVSVRSDGYAHAVNVKLTANFTYCQGIGMRYATRGAR